VSGIAAGLALAALAACLVAAASAVGIAVELPLLRSAIARLRPASRARALFALAVAPALLPLAGVALGFLPSLAGAAGLHADHCVGHPDHPHLCLAHAAAPASPLLAAALGLVAAGGAGAAGIGLSALVRGRRFRARLAAGVSGTLAPEAPDAALLASDAPLSFTAGFARPRIYVSRALCAALAPDDLAVVVAHERAHARRRDPLRLLVARSLSLAHLPPVRRALLHELALACELACDEEAARAVGDRLRVARALLAAERLLAGATPPASLALAFGGRALPARVAALLAEPAAPLPRGLGAAAAVTLAAALALAADPVHHAIEHLLGAILRLA
jgi:Zn-dependent protease with chaperone function